MDNGTTTKPVGITDLALGKSGCFEETRRAGVTFCELKDFEIIQLAVFCEQMREFPTVFKRRTGIEGLPDLSGVYTQGKLVVVRPELTKFWIVRPVSGGNLPLKSLAQYFPLDLTGSRVLLKLSGKQAATLLNRFCAVDLSNSPGDFVATGIHHVPIHILKHVSTEYTLFLPRSFAQSLAELLHHTARQFGVEVKRAAKWERQI